MARQRIKGPSHSHFNWVFFVVVVSCFFEGLSPQSMLLITTEQLNPVYLAANKIETQIMSKKKFTFAEEIDIPIRRLHTELTFGAV